MSRGADPTPIYTPYESINESNTPISNPPIFNSSSNPPSNPPSKPCLPSQINLLSLAAKCSNCHIIQILLNCPQIKSKINDRDVQTGAALLFSTANFGYHTAAIELLHAGAKTEIINNMVSGRTPLLQACADGHELVVESLLKFNADLNAIDINGDTALSLAQARDYLKIVDVLNTYAVRNLSGKLSEIGNVKNELRNIKKTQSLTERCNNQVSIGSGPAEMNRIKPENGKKSGEKVKKADNRLPLPSLEGALVENDLDKYFDNFSKRNCDMTIFLTLTEHELKTVYDIKLFGPRRKISMLIKQLKTIYL